MTNLNTILTAIGHTTELVLPALVPGSGDLIAAAHSLQAAFESVKAANGGQAPADAQASHDALMARVRAHADHTLGRLEGN